MLSSLPLCLLLGVVAVQSSTIVRREYGVRKSVQHVAPSYPSSSHGVGYGSSSSHQVVSSGYDAPSYPAHPQTKQYYASSQKPKALPEGCSAQGGSFTWKHHYYQMFNCPLPWTKARDICRYSMYDAHGYLVPKGDLLTIKNETENSFLQETAELMSFNPGYIGLRFWAVGNDGTRCTADDQYVWATGYDFSFRNFAKGKPDCGTGKLENCIAFLPNGHWDDVKCNLPLNFICKADRYDHAEGHSGFAAGGYGTKSTYDFASKFNDNAQELTGY